jgi:hypothetical protein
MLVRPGLVVGVGVAALLGAAGVVALGGSPTALVLVAVASTTLALRSWLPTTLALALVLSTTFAAVALAMPLWHALGLPMSTMLVLPVVAAAAAWALVWVRRASALRGASTDLALGGAIAALSLLQVAAVPVARWFTDSPKLAWMMKNDAPWNLVSSRFLLEDRGLDPSSHRNPAPLANEVVALFMAPGRSSVARADLLAHDLYRSSEALLLLVGGTSLMAGLLVAAVMPASRPWSRAVLGLVAAAIPWTWSFAGQVFIFGFWNSLPAAILVLSAWSAWVHAERHPLVSSGLLAVIGTGMLAAWAPLVLVPASLGVAVVVWRRRAHLALRGLALVAWLVPLLALGVYLVLVTRGDLAAGRGGLAAQGAFPDYYEQLTLIYWLVPLGILLLLSVWTPVRTELVGALVLGLAGAIGTYYLMGQREGSPAGPWGYYPQKFAWTLSFLAPLVLLMGVRGAVASGSLRRAQRGALVVGITLLSGTLLLQVPPADPRPLTGDLYPTPHRTPDYRLATMAPILSYLLPDRASALDPDVTTLLEVEDPDRKVIVSRWSPEPGINAFLNFWLLQLPVDRAAEQPRPYAYDLDSFDPLALCEVVVDWGGGVVVRTRSDTLAGEMAAICPDQDFEVQVN